jgi:hypothetical protein
MKGHLTSSADRCRRHNSATKNPLVRSHQLVPAQDLGQRLAVNSFTVINHSVQQKIAREVNGIPGGEGVPSASQGLHFVKFLLRSG